MEPQGKKKNKFVNLYSADGQAKDVILLKGRHRCDCQASKHKLINNCMKCGRIVCEQEGSGPCLFCNNLVCSRDEQQLLNSGTKQANQLYQKLVDQKRPEGWESAVEHRNRLLEYDRTSERRTKVIDDESDYFTVNSVWLSKTEREKLRQREEELRAKQHTSRLDRKVTLDFAGRQVVDDVEFELLYDVDDVVLKEISESVQDNFVSNVNPTIMHSGPVFQDSVASESNKLMSDSAVNMSTHRRVQDREMLEMSDEAASKVPTTEEIRQTEHLYKVLTGEKIIKFPSQYPTGCLLGCVTVVDCMPQEEYRKKFPEGESDSPFVFICEDPKVLPIRFPVQGKHKIYKLDPKIHTAALKCLQRMAKIQAERISAQH
ncbi:hypothetical protein L9F63_000265 [Diploptera punctata]|uniref:Zinc finger C2HC5-type domain-containing protein n=1 Tax=Diploptera punctata TaxID=6984 RepID=A0AAD8ALW6_DIPPU|nr:hypothetical protein L9F63_000265 [Diploptera punctata]